MDTKLPFAGQTAIVTGAGQGIGFEMCRQLTAGGAAVLLNDLEPALAETAANRIAKETGGRCVALAGDSGDIGVVNKLVDTAIAQFGGLDIVMANAGITLFGDFFTYSPEAFFRVLQVNLGGTFFLAQAAARVMKQKGKGGSFLFTSSVTGHQAHKDLGVYGMTKAAIEMLAKNLVIELSPFRINVNTVAPGATLTERTKEDASYEDTWSKITPMGRPGTVQDVAAAALFLVSPQARHITGQSLVIDGGWSVTSPSPF